MRKFTAFSSSKDLTASKVPRSRSFWDKLILPQAAMEIPENRSERNRSAAERRATVKQRLAPCFLIAKSLEEMVSPICGAQMEERLSKTDLDFHLRR
jgi:hypothetical protein